ncbi:hypothetical protein SPSYN_00402 [Sporotomaculum syntrophicum]|uniref:Uncharacterized protein n=1 Tax=Sporotomaculum syntrophicum TaxID=182264 RepID=A0A9D3B085_9FIRM|nr:hypothetical protein [Sporotomaculum syntrophicum]KAF1086683.1 hypothetical protein SPSYN_00402 [Sporotomaculum syntrophicum]
MEILRILTLCNYLLGTAVVTTAFSIYITTNKKIPLYIALAIISAGPIEDLLSSYIEQSPSISPDDKKQYIKMVDNITSMVFLILLGLVVLEPDYSHSFFDHPSTYEKNYQAG